MGYRLSKYKMTRYAKNLKGGMTPGYAYVHYCSYLKLHILG